MRALVDGGCDIVEVGIPYSDPVMDGPTIQRATEPAVQAGVGVRDALRAVRAVADAGAVAVTMGYWNQVERFGVAASPQRCPPPAGRGRSRPDLIPDEAGEWIAASDAHELDRIFLVAPSSTDARIASTAAASRGFVYASAVMGVTGARDVGRRRRRDARRPGAHARARHRGVRRARGLTGEQAAQIAAFADGVIVGSALVKCLLDSPDDAGVAAVRALSAELAEGVRRR